MVAAIYAPRQLGIKTIKPQNNYMPRGSIVVTIKSIFLSSVYARRNLFCEDVFYATNLYFEKRKTSAVATRKRFYGAAQSIFGALIMRKKREVTDHSNLSY